MLGLARCRNEATAGRRSGMDPNLSNGLTNMARQSRTRSAGCGRCSCWVASMIVPVGRRARQATVLGQELLRATSRDKRAPLDAGFYQTCLKSSSFESSCYVRPTKSLQVQSTASRLGKRRSRRHALYVLRGSRRPLWSVGSLGGAGRSHTQACSNLGVWSLGQRRLWA